MLRVTANTSDPGSSLARRSFLQVGALGVGGLTLPAWSRLQAEPAIRSKAAGKSVILIWLSGGPGHMETWDPKPRSPAEYRGPLAAIDTSVPGVQFSELMPEEARIADKLAILRTVNHGSGDHTKGNHWMLTGFEGPAFNAPDNQVQRRPALGSAVARVRGPNRPGMPPYVGVPHLRGGTDNLFHYATYLGGGANPFIVNSDPNEKNFSVRNLSLGNDLTLERVADRRTLQSDLDRLRAGAEPRHARSGRAPAGGVRPLDQPAGPRRIRHLARVRQAARPLRPAHVRPKHPARPAARRKRGDLRHRQLRPLGPPRLAGAIQNRGRRPAPHSAAGPGDRGPGRAI